MQIEARSTRNGGASGEIIEGLRARIEAWRSSEHRGRRMPEELWQEAGAVAQKLGVCPVSRALGLGYQTLKRRVSPSESSPSNVVNHPRFIEFAGFAPINGVAADEVIIEMVFADGSRLTVRLKDSSPALLTVIQAWRGRL
jgi:hypothetical protein